MIGTQCLPALAFLAAISGLPGLKGLPTPATKEYKLAKEQAAAADTLPPPWKPSWRLALENRALFAGLMPIGSPRGPVKLQQGTDPRRVHVSIDPDSGTYTSATEVGEVTLVPSYRRPLTQFTREYAARTFQEKWAESARQNVNSLGSNTPVQRQGISLPIPVRLPQRISSILGPGGPALNVSGSESIRLSGTSNWTNAELGAFGVQQKKSLFPSLDMQQDLDIRLEGQLSDRIKVNLLQNSANQVPLANRIAINYRGDEDDFVQALDLGNTSLSLPGTQYVSYSGRNEGLFGVKFASRIGALDLTTLASKQEGRSERAVYSGGASVTAPKPFPDYDWVKGQYFLLYDPNFGTFYDIDEKTIRIYLDDANASNDRNFTLGKAVIDPGEVFQMGAPTPDTTFIYGRFEQLTAGADQQYEILNNVFAFHDTVFKVIRLKVPLLGNQTLAATYTARAILGGGQLGPPLQVGGGDPLPPTPGSPDSARTLLKLLRVPREEQKSLVDRRFDPNNEFALVRELELKNIYNLGGYGIDPKTFKLAIKSGQEEPPVTDLQGFPFIEMVGLDTWNEQNAQPIKAPPHDGQVDRTGYNTQTRSWVDYDNGTIMLPDWQPFAPRISGPNQKPFDVFLHQQAVRRKLLDGPEKSLNAPNPEVYDLSSYQAQDAQYYFITEFAAARSGGSSDITLGRGNILDNSEAVVVNGERWVRDRDYTIDYDLGRIQLKKQLGPTDQLSVDYSYAPLFAQASKTLIGSAFRLEGRDRSLGGAFLYESKGAQDIRPRLGEEPSRTLITDLNTEWRFKPAFMTRLADALPGVRTTAPSDLTVQAEAGMSFPNPNTRNEVYVDDMEGVRDAVSLSMIPTQWRLSSVPRRATTVANGNAVATQSYLTLPKYWNAELHWFIGGSDNNNDTHDLTRERDLRPLLQSGQNPDNFRPGILSLSVPKTPNPALTPNFALGDTMWAGLTYNLDPVGFDLSRSQFIEVWVSDWNDHHDPSQRIPRVRGDGTPGSSVKLHIDLGRVSEDQQRAPNRIPNGRIDTEDVPPRDNQLVVTGDDSEDTGIDGIFNNTETATIAPDKYADLVTSSSFDPEGDDWQKARTDFPSAMDPRNWRNWNGTENNQTNFPVPNTEDMNLNERPDTTEAYFEYTIDLGQQDSPYIVTDVVRDFSGVTAIDSTKNGWRRYRIPITDSLRVRFGAPDLTIAQHVRLWIDGLRTDEQTSASNQRPLLMIAGVDIVGSRWLAADLTPRQRDTLSTSVTLNAANTQDNADIYDAPFDPGTTKGNNQEVTRREQSMAMEFVELNPADTLEAFKTFSIAENYSRYGVLRWFANSFDVKKVVPTGAPAVYYDPVADSLFYFVRFASDDKGQSYYEVKRKLPRTTPRENAPVRRDSWEEVLAELERLSEVKLAPDFPVSGNILYRTRLANGDSLILAGRPSFTRLQRISFGVINESAVDRFSGQLWFDELRATDIAKDVGLANRVLVNGRWANLMDYNVAWTSRDADFLSVGETRGTGARNTNLNISTRFEPHRFFEGTGILLPISFAQNENRQRPRFAAGDDIVRTGALEDLSESRAVSRSISTSYSRVWSDRANPFLRYTLGGVTANYSRSTSDSRNPTSLAKSTTVAGGVSYQIAPRQLLQLPLPFTKAKLFPLPERFYWNYGVTTTKSTAFTRTFGSDTLRPSSSQNGRAATVNFGTDTRPFDLLSHHFEGQRNLALEGMRMDHLGFLNFGRLTSWRQSFSSHASINPHPFLRPSFNWSSNYSQNYNLQSKELFQRAITNGQEVSMNMDLPFDKIGTNIGVNAPRPQSQVDSGKVVRPRRSLPWKALLQRLGAISTDGRVGRTSSYSLISGNASPLYMVGLADNPGFGHGKIFAEPGNVSANGLDWRTNARSTFPLAFGSQIMARFSYGDAARDNNGVKSRDRDWRFPDFEVQYGRIANMVGLTRFLDSPQLRTAYSRSHSVNYTNSHKLRTGTSRSDDFRPLFSIRGRLRNGTDADLRLERRSTVRESFLLGSSRATDQTTDVNFSLTRSYSQGQKVNLLGKTTTVKTNVSLSLTTVYSRQKGGVKVGNEEKLANPVDRTRLSVNGTGSYGFSSNVTGDLALGFSHFRETNGIFRRSIRVELRGQFRF